MVKSSGIDMRTIVDALPDAALIVAPDGQIVLANELAATMVKYSRSALEGLSIEALVPEDSRAAHHEHRARYVAGAQMPGPMAWGRRLRARRADGSLLPVDVSLARVDIEDRALVLACIRDMTEYERLLVSLKESEERYRQIVDGASEVFYRVTFDQDDPLTGRCNFVSPQCYEITGRHPDEFLTDPELWYHSVHDEDRMSLIKETAQCLGSKTEGTRYYRLRHHPTGECRWIADRIVPVLDSEGRIAGYQGVARDITKRRLADEDRHRLELRLAQGKKMEMLGQLAGGVAHDFNNLLTVIIGGCELAQTEINPESAAAREVAQVAAAAERAADLTRQLLGFGRKQVISPQVLDLRTYIRAMQELLRRTIPESIRIDLLLPDDLGAVRIDPTQVGQIVINLAVNARDAMPRGGLLAIEAANVTLDDEHCAGRAGLVPGEYIRLTVRDTGHGMDADTLEHVFEPFFTTKSEGQGSGLGLASVYGIVKQNSGFIEIASEEGHGTAFVIHLPRSHDHVLDAPEPTNIALRANIG